MAEPSKEDKFDTPQTPSWYPKQRANNTLIGGAVTTIILAILSSRYSIVISQEEAAALTTVFAFALSWLGKDE